MAKTSVKVQFIPSTVEGKKGSIYYQIVRHGRVRRVASGLRCHKEEWVGNTCPGQRLQIGLDLYRLAAISQRLERESGDYTADNVATAFKRVSSPTSFFNFMRSVITQLDEMGKVRTCETYISALHSFCTFRGGEDLSLGEITATLMCSYEAYLQGQRGLTRNTSSFYLRILRAVYRRAIDDSPVQGPNPFRRVYTGVDKTRKRAISLQGVKAIKRLRLYAPSKPMELARDLFLFSFYTRGMAFIDMAFLKKTDLTGGYLSYCRHKTGQRLTIKVEACMLEIILKYQSPATPYLLPIIKTAGDAAHERKQYLNALRSTNFYLKKISKMAGTGRADLSTYASRHSWASAAKGAGIPMAVISKGMGHDSEATTQIYLDAIDDSAVDKANKTILAGL